MMNFSKARLFKLLTVCLITLQVQACADATPPATPQDSPDIDQLLETLDAGTEHYANPQPVQWPDDFLTHPAMQFESFALQAIVYPADAPILSDDSPKASVMLQMDRLGLTSPAAIDLAASAWQYSGLMRTAVSVDTEVGQSAFQTMAILSPKQAVQRMALGLAGIEDNTLSVVNDRLSIDVAATQGNPCLRQYRWAASASEDIRLVLDFSMDNCPRGQSIGLLSNWQQSAVRVSGFLISGAGNENVDAANELVTRLHGVAWFSQRWGNLPASGGAVVIDTLQLQLDSQRVLDVSRSKRRSGRGPQTVSATMRTLSQPSQSLSLRWEDSAAIPASTSHQYVPGSIRLISDDQNLDVRVSAMNRLTGTVGIGGERLQGAVMVEGTHHGVGFLAYTPLAVSP